MKFFNRKLFLLLPLNINIYVAFNPIIFVYRSVQNNRYCFVENAYENKLLTDCEYKILQSWFDFTESQVDLSLDLIGTVFYSQNLNL